VGKPEGKRLLGRLSHRWVGNIKIDLRHIGWCGMDRIDLAQDGDHCMALLNTVMNLWPLYNFWKFLSSSTTGGFSRRTMLLVVSWILYLS
jgi:hypothetical protein